MTLLFCNKETLKRYKEEINNYLINNLKLELHKDKSKIYPMYKGVSFLGYKIFYYHKLIRKRNIKHFNKKLLEMEKSYYEGFLTYDNVLDRVNGWLAYAMWADTYKLRKNIIKK